MANVETRQTYQELMHRHNIPVRFVGDELTQEVVKGFLINFMADPPKGVLTDKTPAGAEALANQKKLKEKAIAAWKKLTGKAPLLDGGRVAPPLFFGPPGFGKTDTYKAAGLLLAELMEMDLVLDPGVDSYIDRNTLVLSFIDSSGSNSSLDAGGIPFKDLLKTVDFNNQQVVTHVMNMMLKPSLAAIGKAGAGILIPDDIGNYAEAVQQAFLSVALEQKLGEKRFTNMTVGFASNLGKIDKTAARELSRAITGRCSVMGVITNPEDVYNYLKTKLPVTAIDASPMISALKRNERNMDYVASDGSNPAEMHIVPEAGDRGGFPAPRNICAAWKQARHYINAHDSLLDAMPEVRSCLVAHLGLTYGEKLSNSMDIYARGAAPIADKLINYDNWDEAAFKKSMGVKKVKGEETDLVLNLESRQFLSDLASALTDYATNRALMVNPKDKQGKCYAPDDTETLKRFFKGLNQLSRVVGFPTDEFATIAISDYFSVLPRKLGENSEYVKNEDGTVKSGQLSRKTCHSIALKASEMDISLELFNSLKRIATADDKKQDARVESPSV